MATHALSPFAPAVLLANAQALIHINEPDAATPATLAPRHRAAPSYATAICEAWLANAYVEPQTPDWEDFTIGEPPC